MAKKEIKETLVKLGRIFREDEEFINSSKEIQGGFVLWKNSWQLAEIKNPWFTQEFIELAVKNWGKALQPDAIDAWLKDAELPNSPKTVALILAGNLPLVGLHDIISVIFSGHKALVKPSSDDEELIINVLALLQLLDPEMKNRYQLAKGKLENFDAVIATGSNSSNQFFESYFGKYPHIFRGNRTSIAVLTGNETDEQMSGLADDIFQFFGQGCRSVSKVMVPKGFDPNKLLNAFRKYEHLIDHNKYANNYMYHKSIFGMNLDKFHDFGLILLRKVPDLHAGLSCLNYEEYESLEAVEKMIALQRDEIQCVACADVTQDYEVALGTTQQPQLWDYADGIDTIDFLGKL